MLLYFCAGGLWVSAAIALHRDFAGVLYVIGAGIHFLVTPSPLGIPGSSDELQLLWASSHVHWGYPGASIALACCLRRVNASAFHALYSRVF